MAVVSLEHQFKNHQCGPYCLIRRSDVTRSGQQTEHLEALSEIDIMRASQEIGLSRGSKQKASAMLLSQSYFKRQRQNEADPTSVKDEVQSKEWPQIITEAEKSQILNEFIDSTSNHAVRHIECSFCVLLDVADRMSFIGREKLDISILQIMVEKLKVLTGQCKQKVFHEETLIRNQYTICTHCK